MGEESRRFSYDRKPIVHYPSEVTTVERGRPQKILENPAENYSDPGSQVGISWDEHRTDSEDHRQGSQNLEGSATLL